LNIVRLAAQEDHLEAGIVIEMRVKRRDDHFMMFVLKVGELFREKASVMVIDQRYCPDDWSPGGDNCTFHEPVPNQVAECFGSVLITLFNDELVKTIQ
jgi:hypothetical protein